MKKNVEKILQYVQKPARYAGGELNSVIKNKSQIDLRYAFCFPDIYEIGMSHLGMKILYSLVNSRDDSCASAFLRRIPIWKSKCVKTMFRFLLLKAEITLKNLMLSASRLCMSFHTQTCLICLIFPEFLCWLKTEKTLRR